MSDLETPEADVMRGHRSVDGAPATLRPEETRPGLDPDSPGAAPNTTLDHVARAVRKAVALVVRCRSPDAPQAPRRQRCGAYIRATGPGCARITCLSISSSISTTVF